MKIDKQKASITFIMICLVIITIGNCFQRERVESISRTQIYMLQKGADALNDIKQLKIGLVINTMLDASQDDEINLIGELSCNNALLIYSLSKEEYQKLRKRVTRDKYTHTIQVNE